MRADGAQYLLPGDLAPERAGLALLDRLSLRSGPASSRTRDFYDTFDGRLHAAGLVVLHADGRLALATGSAYSELAAAKWPEPPERVAARELPAGRLRDLLLPIVAERALLPVARTRSRQRRLDLLNDDGKVVARLALEQPVVRRGGASVALGARLIVRAVRGYEAAPRRIAPALGALGLTVAERPLHVEAVAAAGGRPGGTRIGLDVGLSPDLRADAAAAAVLRRLLEVIGTNLEGALADLDAEFLHDLRVAVRRTRSVQRQLAGVFPPAPLGAFRAGFRWLGQVTGPARDLSVFLLDLDELEPAPPAARELEPLRRVLARRSRLERERMAGALRSPAATGLLSGWARLLDCLAELPQDERPDAARPIGDVAGERIQAVHRRMLRRGRAIGDASPPEALHELRKRGKELRYLLELFGGPDRGAAGRSRARALKALQDVLGRHQDREVQAAIVRALAESVRLERDGARALMAMGLLAERLEREQAAARSEFAAAFAAFAGEPEAVPAGRRAA